MAAKKRKFLITKRKPRRMTRALAEVRAVGDAHGTKFDGVSFLKSLKK